MRHNRQLCARTLVSLGPLLLFGAAAVIGGCIVDSECDRNACPTCESCSGDAAGGAGSGGSPAPSDQIARATIDAGETLDADPGDGIGVFIEYQAGGRWHVFVTCDTNLSGLPCALNVIALVPAGVSYSNVLGESLERDDAIYEHGDAVELVTTTSSDFDGMNFETPAGTTVRFEVHVDGQRDPRFVYWVGGGALHSGAPSNPIELQPSE